VIPLDNTLDLERSRIDVPIWAWLVVALAVTAVYAVLIENGATLSTGARFLHEFFHDGRHFLGVPCH
jgi:hypothetical protein